METDCKRSNFVVSRIGGNGEKFGGTANEKCRVVGMITRLSLGPLPKSSINELKQLSKIQKSTRRQRLMAKYLSLLDLFKNTS